ncbi:MAG TPA: LysE family translocator [Pseudolabrys sp.]|jgi:threonine/homoserine/homoserine lactone efflux protein|nr:LysE family translocator [Pseudolabrys sp.]
MPATANLIAFASLAVAVVLTPGPNMIYMISRSITQGRLAGIIAFGGVAVGFVVYLLCAAFGLTAIVFAVPYAYDALRFVGAAYIAWLAFEALRPGGKSPFQVRTLPVASTRRLFLMGLLTSLLNPKMAIFYLALLPNFVDPAGNVLGQSIALGSLHIVISITINMGIACAAGSIAAFLMARPKWLLAQRWVMGTMLGALAMRMALEGRR